MVKVFINGELCPESELAQTSPLQYLLNLIIATGVLPTLEELDLSLPSAELWLNASDTINAIVVCLREDVGNPKKLDEIIAIGVSREKELNKGG